ncbi:Ras-related protein Rab-8A, partial [Araneus ventricosus]
DTAGQERFRTLTTAYYRGAMGILVMYDVTNMDSFNHLSYWFRNVEENASPDVVKVLVGNKCDSSNLRVIDQDQGRKIAESCDVPFFECSCKEGVNIDEIFMTVARMIREQRERRASKFDEIERQQWDKAHLTQQKPQDPYKCSC